jgi:hypothetical protein
MQTSDGINEIATALAKAQGEMGSATKDAENPFFKSKYADLASVVRAVKEPFAKNGLSYTQGCQRVDQSAGVTTLLMHTSGQWIKSEYTIPLSKFDAQSIGSAFTYARRYALQAMAGIPADDDDGNHATEAAPQPETELERHLRVLEENRKAVNACKVAIHKEDWDALVDGVQQISNEDRLALWNPAPTKGGEAWTVAERKALRSDEYNAAKNRWFAKQGEQNEES